MLKPSDSRLGDNSAIFTLIYFAKGSKVLFVRLKHFLKNEPDRAKVLFGVLDHVLGNWFFLYAEKYKEKWSKLLTSAFLVLLELDISKNCILLRERVSHSITNFKYPHTGTSARAPQWWSLLNLWRNQFEQC